MSRTAYILAGLLCSFLCYGQQITFQGNVNYKANTLLQNLNTTGDVLLLESLEKPIQQIDIFNDEYSESIDVNHKKARVDLKKLPPGNFVIQARIDKKMIIMSVQKSKEIELVAVNNKEKTIKAPDVILNIKSRNSKPEEKSLYYWVVSEKNSNFGSNKSMRLEYKEDLDKLILRHKLEVKSNAGKNNKLEIYEIYDTSEFMPKQLKDPSYYKSEESNNFNVIPIYASRN